MIFWDHSHVELLALSVSLKLLPAKSPFVSVQAATFPATLPVCDPRASIPASLMVIPCFSGADGGSYDVVNDASSPAARECCAQQSSARHNWEMNYQEAAIYLQVSPAGSGGGCSAGATVVLAHGKQTASILGLKIRCFAKGSASGVRRCWRHLQRGFGSHLEQLSSKTPTLSQGLWWLRGAAHAQFCYLGMEIFVAGHRLSFHLYSRSRGNGQCPPGDISCSGSADPNPALARGGVGGGPN